MYREIIDCLPHVYSQHQAMRIIGPDDKQSVVWINQHLSDNPKPDPKTGRVRMLDLSDGRYDVIADVGPELSHTAGRDSGPHRKPAADHAATHTACARCDLEAVEPGAASAGSD
jgi:hypothetical protein